MVLYCFIDVYTYIDIDICFAKKKSKGVMMLKSKVLLKCVYIFIYNIYLHIYI